MTAICKATATTENEIYTDLGMYPNLLVLL